MLRTILQAHVVLLCLIPCPGADAGVTVFFDSSQIATDVASGVTGDKISSEGYLFTYTRDKLFTGGGSDPIGRPVRVAWPDGVEAQAVTTPPPGVNDYKARIVLQRVDGGVFDLTAFTARLLGNTWATGAAIEIMPSLMVRMRSAIRSTSTSVGATARNSPTIHRQTTGAALRC
jgi:hypothetical protein